jgi:hypothetical protein
VLVFALVLAFAFVLEFISMSNPRARQTHVVRGADNDAAWTTARSPDREGMHHNVCKRVDPATGGGRFAGGDSDVARATDPTIVPHAIGRTCDVARLERDEMSLNRLLVPFVPAEAPGHAHISDSAAESCEGACRTVPSPHVGEGQGGGWR